MPRISLQAQRAMSSSILIVQTMVWIMWSAHYHNFRVSVQKGISSSYRMQDTLHITALCVNKRSHLCTHSHFRFVPLLCCYAVSNWNARNRTL